MNHPPARRTLPRPDPLPESGAPVFVVGANRSGTTLLRLVLNAHSRLALPEELAYFNGRLAGVPLDTWRAPGLTQDQYRRFVRSFVRRHAETFAPLDTDALEAEIMDHPEVSLRRPYATALAAWARCHGKARWGEKTPGNLFFAATILEMFPDARFVYIARDPRAGVASMLRATMFADDVAINALNRVRYATEGRGRLEQAVPPIQRMTLRYEDLVAEPEATVRSLCRFLDEPFEPSMLRFYTDAEDYMTARAASDFNRSATRPISTARIDEWRRQLSPDDVALVEHICADEMARFGYERTAPTSPALAQKLDVWTKRGYLMLQCWRHPHAPQYLLKHRLFDRSRNRLHRAHRRLTRQHRPAAEMDAL